MKKKYIFKIKGQKLLQDYLKKHLNKIISTVFTKDTKGKYGYLKKEIISNIEVIFYAAIPILKHSELKKEILYDKQIIHRFALPMKIGGFILLAMITSSQSM